MFHAAFAIALKDLKLLFRDWTSAFFTFGFPLALAVFFGMVFGGGSDGSGSPVTLAIVHEGTEPPGKIATSFVADLEADEMIETVAMPDRAAGEAFVREGKALACVVIPADFDRGANSMFTGGGLAVEALVDPSRKAEAGLLTGKLNEIAFRQLNGIFGDTTQMKSMLDTSRAAILLADMPAAEKRLYANFFDSAEHLSAGPSGKPDAAGEEQDGAGRGAMGNFSPAKVTVTELKPKERSGPTNSYSISFPQGVAWGLMGCVMSFAAGIAQERTRGTLLRLIVAPITRRQVLFGKALGCFIACMLVIVLLMIFGRFVLGVEIGNPPLFLLSAAVASFGFSGVMMFLAGVFRTESGAEGAGRAIILVLAMIGGGTIPLFFMPKFLATASMISPFRWAIFAVEGAIWRGLTLTQLLPALGALMLFGIVGFAVGGYGFTKSQAR
jgi:ABC-2 type transport system permease protein